MLLSFLLTLKPKNLLAKTPSVSVFCIDNILLVSSLPEMVGCSLFCFKIECTLVHKIQERNCVREKKLRKQDSFPCGRLSFLFCLRWQITDYWQYLFIGIFLVEWWNAFWWVCVAFYGVACLGGIGILLRCEVACMGRVVGSVTFGFCVSVWGMLLCLWVGMGWFGLARFSMGTLGSA